MSTSDSFPPEENRNSTNEIEEVIVSPAGEKTAEEGSPSSPESVLPPEAQGDVNGGPLGCCLGVTVGLLLSLSIGIFSRFYADPLAGIFSGNLVLIVRILMALVAIAAAIIFGYLGWKVGKRVYKEYEAPVIKERSRKSAKTRRV